MVVIVRKVGKPLGKFVRKVYENNILDEALTGLAYSIVPIYLVAEDGAFSEERAMATSIGLIVTALFRLDEIYVNTVVKKTLEVLKGIPIFLEKTGQNEAYLSASKAFPVVALVNGFATAVANALMAEDSEVAQVLGAVVGINAFIANIWFIEQLFMKENKAFEQIGLADLYPK